jgi:AraC-like DNA-binding protein
MNANILKEEKNKNAFINYLDQAISIDLKQLVFTRKLLSKKFQVYTHPQFRLILLLKGDYTYKILGEAGLKNAYLAPGKALFCQHNGVTGRIESQDSNEWEMLTIVFWPHLTRFLFSKREKGFTESTHTWYHSHNTVNQAGIYVLKALNELVQGDDSNIQACLLAKALLNICRNHLINDSSQTITKSFRTYQNIMVYLYENSNQKINRENVAEALKITPSHISKLFAEYNEHNFNTVLKILRIEYAEELLRDTDYLVAEIAEQCGFISTEYFIKTFKHFHGETPGEFRRNSLNKAKQM